MGSFRTDLNGRICLELVDHFDRLPDSLILLDCVISTNDASSPSSSSSAVSASAVTDKSRNSLSSLFRLVLSGLIKPFQSFTQFITNAPRHANALSALDDDDFDHSSVTHHSPIKVLKNFNKIKSLRIELPSGELGIAEGVLLHVGFKLE